MGASTNGSTSVSETSIGRRPFSVLAAACLTAAALAACTPSGGGGGGGGGGVSEYDFVDGNCSTTACPSSQQGSPNQSHPYNLIGVNVALDGGFTGVSQLVAVMDNGYLLSHQELNGKSITVYHPGGPGLLPVEDHGTSVAALIGAIMDGEGMHGVAPDVALHLSSYQVGATFDANLTHLANATEDAAIDGAVAQNNSWGFVREVNGQQEDYPAQELFDYLQSHPLDTAADGLASIIDGTAGAWQNYIDAFNTFQANGVIVWAVSNDQGLIDADIMSTLPFFETTLADAWIAVVNGYFEVNANGDITAAALLSAHCGQYAAEFCIAADGTVWVPGDNSNTYYYQGTGTSFAAPQVAAAVAIMAQAFPALSPEEWADRLLSTADNSWFVADGTTDFGGGIMHDYSIDWGHGVLDLEAALSPIGPVAVLSGDTVTTANRTALNDGIVVTTAGFGDGLQRALAGRDMAVFDALNGNFTVDAGDLVQSAPFSGLPVLSREIRADDVALAPSTGMTLTNDLAGIIFTGQGLTSQASVLSLADNAAIVRGTADYGRFGLSAFGYAADHQAYGDALMSGAGVNASFETRLGTFSIGISQSLERGALLGLVGNDAFDFGAGSSITAAHFGVTREFGSHFAVFGNLEIGVAQAIGAASGDLIASIEPAGFNGFSVGATVGGVIARNGSLTFSVTQPTRINSGAATINMPVGRTIDGAITTESVRAEFAPTGRQLDLGLIYALGLGENSQLRFGVQYSLDAGHVDGAKGVAAMVGYGINF